MSKREKERVSEREIGEERKGGMRKRISEQWCMCSHCLTIAIYPLKEVDAIAEIVFTGTLVSTTIIHTLPSLVDKPAAFISTRSKALH